MLFTLFMIVRTKIIGHYSLLITRYSLLITRNTNTPKLARLVRDSITKKISKDQFTTLVIINRMFLTILILQFRQSSKLWKHTSRP